MSETVELSKFLVFGGNEFGTALSDKEPYIIGLKEADRKFDEIVKEHGCAVMYEVRHDCLLVVKNFTMFNEEEQ